jgi:transcriptional regulator of NAD metabolism
MRLIDQSGDTKTYMGMDELTGTIQVTTEQDLSGFLERMKQKRQFANETWTKGVKEEWLHYASIPTVVIMQLKQKGIDVFNPDDEKRMLREINANYPMLKMVDRTHE